VHHLPTALNRSSKSPATAAGIVLLEQSANWRTVQIYSYRHCSPPPQVLAARSIIALYRDMQDAIERYRDLLPPPYEPVAGTDDIPF